MVPPASRRVPRAPRYSGFWPRKPGSFRLRDYHPLWSAFPDRSARSRVSDFPAGLWPRPARSCNPRPATPTGLAQTGFGLFPVRSPLLGESRLLSFPPGTEMFHFPGLAQPALWIQAGATPQRGVGLPHSEIPGSQPVCGSPRLIAAYHVLHRLLTPRHPPYALRSLTTHFTLRL